MNVEALQFSCCPKTHTQKKTGVADPAAAVAARPSLLGLDVDGSLRKIVDYLTYVDTPPAKIIEYITRSI